VRTRSNIQRVGFLAALFALAAQLVLGIAAPDIALRPTPDQQLAALLADPGAICHGATGEGQRAPHHHAADCLICPYCAAIAAAVAVRSDDPTLPIPRAGSIAVSVVVPAGIVPPPSPPLAAPPRGPPILA
jgi:DNA-binding helix-hairpin-helix protein with protein kinase domain